MNGTEEIGYCSAYCGTCREYLKTQGLQGGVSGRLPGPEPGKVQDEKVLPGQRTCHLRKLRGVRILRDHPIVSQPPRLQV